MNDLKLPVLFSPKIKHFLEVQDQIRDLESSPGWLVLSSASLTLAYTPKNGGKPLIIGLDKTRIDVLERENNLEAWVPALRSLGIKTRNTTQKRMQAWARRWLWLALPLFMIVIIVVWFGIGLIVT